MARPRDPSPPSPSPIRVPDAVLVDLRARLERVRFPQAPTPGWEFGADLETLRELVGFWRDGFDWRRQERLLEERLPSQRARVRGLDLHFARLEGRGPRPFPLLLLHGWPGSWFEMIEVAGPLADPAAHGGDAADSFDLVIPSLPGHGFSEAPGDPLFGADDAADVLRDLMVDVLGHRRFGAQGGDRGAFVAAGLAPPPRGSRRDPPEPRDGDSGAAGRAPAGGGALARGAGALAAGGGRLLGDPVDAPADARLRPRGLARGHFAAMEEPRALVEDVRRFFRAWR